MFGLHRAIPVPTSATAITLSLMLGALGQETKVTYDARSGLSITRSYNPEIAFSDIAN